MKPSQSILPLLWMAAASAQNVTIDLQWHAPNKTWINDLTQVLNGSGTNGFIFNNSALPEGIKYGTYNWCNMPHAKPEEYPTASEEYVLGYVEVVNRNNFTRRSI